MYITDLYEDDLEVAIKVVIVGNGAVGKSSLIQRYCRGIFTQSYKKTIGVDFLEKHLRVMGEEVRLMLWDTAGQEEFDAITKAYYRGAQACVVAFSTTDRASFDAVRKWKRKVEDECGSIPMVLVQNKIDLMHDAQVSSDEVEQLARELHMRLYRTSVKDDVNVCGVFQHLAENYVDGIRGLGIDGPALDELGLRLPVMQIGVGSRPNVTTVGIGGTGNMGGTGIRTNPNTLYNRTARNRQVALTSAKKNKRNIFYQTNAPTNNGATDYYRQQYHHRPAAQQPQSPPQAATSRGGFSPQDYLNNPMFDSLHHHRRYWPVGVDRRGTITLGPLKKNVHKRMPITRSACKVL